MSAKDLFAQPALVEDKGLDAGVSRLTEVRIAEVIGAVLKAEGGARLKAYVDTCHALELYGDKEKLEAEHREWADSHNRTYNLLKAMFPSVYHEEEK